MTREMLERWLKQLFQWKSTLSYESQGKILCQLCWCNPSEATRVALGSDLGEVESHHELGSQLLTCFAPTTFLPPQSFTL